MTSSDLVASCPWSVLPDMTTLSGPQIAEAGLTDWVFLLGGLQTRLLTQDFATGLRLVGQIGAGAEEANHHPDLDLRYGHLDIRLSSHDAGGVTERDLSLARTISDVAAASGVGAAPHEVQRLEIGLDTPDAERLSPFWAAVLHAEAAGEGVEVGADALPTLWFQVSGSEEPRQRFHYDLWVAPEVVEARIASAIAAGGTLASDSEAPSFWVLADPEGNRVCLCTWQQREHS